MIRFAAPILLALLAAGAAQAQPDGTEGAAPREVVRYEDLDLSRPAGVAALDRRIAAAAARLCGPRVASEAMVERAQRLGCIRDARTSADAGRGAAIAAAGGRLRGTVEIALVR